MQENKNYTAGLYLRLSKDDEREGESSSIGTQRAMLLEHCQINGYTVYDIYVDDGYSGLNFNRPGFQRMLEDIENGKINMVITKDLSRLGRDYIMTGYYSEIYFNLKDIRYIALADDVDTSKGHNDIAPFRNILNNLYARDISKKIKGAKHQHAKLGQFIGSQAPYGYIRDPEKRCLIVDSEAAELVKTIFALAEQGLGNIAIAKELRKRAIIAPSAYKYQHGDKKFAEFTAVKSGDYYNWCYVTINLILHNPVYIGDLVSLKTEIIDCLTKRYVPVPPERQIYTEKAHEAIISREQFDRVQQIRASRDCVANHHRENLFRGKLFCECCGHPLSISRKELKEKTTDMYLCMYHYRHPEICPQTHRVYHDMLYC